MKPLTCSSLLRRVVVSAALTAFASNTAPAEERHPQVLERVAFGSCADQNAPQPIWDTAVKEKPDAFLLVGDNIYGDTVDMEVMKEKYALLGSKPGYQAMLKTCHVLATWDDHDYGLNDGGAGYSRKAESQQVMLDFFNVPADSPRRKRAGVYESYRFGPDGKRTQIILLDTRYFRSRPKKDTRSKEEKEELNLVGWYVPDDNPENTVLGAEQWAWLEEQLKLPAELRLVVSSFQVIAGEKGMESWGNFPLERKKLYDLIDQTGASGVVFLSGDVHFSEISRTDDGPYPLYDFTSSGITNSSPGWAARVNPHRVSEKAFAEPTFGMIRVDWSGAAPELTLQACGVDGAVAFENKISVADLRKK